MKRSSKLIATLLLALAALPIGAWSFFKPIRVIAPELNGLTCAGAVCVENLSTLSRAEELHATAMGNIAGKLRPLSSPPRAMFCSTKKCYQSFGGRGAGIAVFNLGVVIAPESWNLHIVEHELIHMLQAQELGLRGRERTPMWFKEGMPFYISDPPEADLPDYAKPWVAEYMAWEQRVGRENVWSQIREYR
jgi:hypothetical protein